MLSTNPFADLATSISPEIMQGYIILMFLLVVVGTMIDVIHKKSAQYFFENSKKQQMNAKRTVGGGEKASAAIGVVLNIWATLWHLGAASLALGGYWFWFIIRVDVSAEGHKWYQLAKADLFIVSALMMVTWGLIWSLTGGGLSGINLLFFVLFILSATTLFSTVLWSKFAHMFFKPAAAFQKRVTKLDGSQENLPDVGEMNDPAIQAKFPDIPEYMGKNPPNMGLGIKSEPPHHY